MEIHFFVFENRIWLIIDVCPFDKKVREREKREKKWRKVAITLQGAIEKLDILEHHKLLKFLSALCNIIFAECI